MKRAVMAFALVTVLCACSRKGDALTIPTGSRVRVEQTNGVSVEGRLVDVSADRIVVEREGGERTAVVRRDIKEIRTAPVSSAAESSALPTPASATASATMDVTIPAGTVLSVDLETSVGSDTSRVDQPVRGVLHHPLHLRGMNVLPTGTAVFGHVTTAQRPGKVKGRGVIAMRFTEIDTPGAGRTRISTQTVSRMAPASTKKDTLQILGPAAGAAAHRRRHRWRQGRGGRRAHRRRRGHGIRAFDTWEGHPSRQGSRRLGEAHGASDGDGPAGGLMPGRN